jgi:hypothetical protein
MTVVSGWSTEMDQIPAQTTGNPYKPYVVQFYPDGSATRTLIRLSKNDDSYLIGVDWLVGRVTVSEVRTDGR